MNIIDDDEKHNASAHYESKEGKQIRDLFRTEDDSTSEDDEEDVVVAEIPTDSSCCIITAHEFITRCILNVTIEEQQVGGSIAHRLWPAALHLAEFIMELRQSPSHIIFEDRNAILSSDEPTHHQSSHISHKRHHHEQKQNALDRLSVMLMQTEQEVNEKGMCNLCILELGAGIGLTGLQLATVLHNTRVLLTDLDEGLPLLQRNTQLNQEKFAQNTTVQVQRLAWAEPDDIARAAEWYQQFTNNNDEASVPLLMLAADCVYWEELQLPLEKTLFALLSSCRKNSHTSSLCVMASARRWKRDNAFYHHLGKATRTDSHTLQCTCLQETVTRTDSSADDDSIDDGNMDGAAINDEESRRRREILRVYAVEWLPNQNNVSAKTL